MVLEVLEKKREGREKTCELIGSRYHRENGKEGAVYRELALPHSLPLVMGFSQVSVAALQSSIGGSAEQDTFMTLGIPLGRDETICSTDDFYLLSKLRAEMFPKDKMSVVGQDDRPRKNRLIL